MDRWGVVAEMLGFEPGELEVVSAGVNHLNWLFDVRRKGTRESFLEEFLERVRSSEYWRRNHRMIPKQTFTLEVLFDAMNLRNHGAVGNLPDDVILDVPAVAVGGDVRSLHVGDLPPGHLEICRRQTVLHELIARATHEGDDALAVQALCLDPYVRSLTQARQIWSAFKDEYRADLPTFCR